MRDKDLKEIGAILFPKAETLILTAPDNPRAMSAAELSEFVPKNFDSQKVFQIENVGAALKFADEITNGKQQICVTGSLYLVGEAQKILMNDDQLT